MEAVLNMIQEKIQASLKRRGGGAKYFGTARRGEMAELQQDLNSSDMVRQRSAVKRVIANMTMGKDVSHLFVHIVKLGQTTNLELKKLVYLYILNTAKLQPDTAILAVNTFLHDTQSASPIVRALAIRSMMCIRVRSVIDYTLEPLRRKAADEDPYVRKTVAIGLGKLFHHDMATFYDQGLVEELVKLLKDTNAVVVSNAAAVLSEVLTYGNRNSTITLPEGLASRLMLVLGDTTEWGQQYTLELLATLKPANVVEALVMSERVMPWLNHSNPAVVMAAIKVIANVASVCPSDEIDRFTQRITPCLLTLSKADPETQFIACQNIYALLVIFPNLLMNNLDAFYVRFNDPPYVKLEKLKLLLRLVKPATATGVVNELAEYSTEVDPVFVEAVVSAIASLAVLVESVSMQCAELLMRIVERRPELLPRVTTAAQSIVRRYPDLLLLEPLITQYGADSVVDEDAKVALVWMLGEYCDFVEGGPAILKTFTSALLKHEPSVQLAILTAAVKVFLREGATDSSTITGVMEQIVAHSLNPDVRDRACAYWRLLTNRSKLDNLLTIVNGYEGERMPVSAYHAFSDAMTMGDLKRSINTAAIIFGQPYQTFLAPYGLAEADDGEDEDEDEFMDDGELDVAGFPSGASRPSRAEEGTAASEAPTIPPAAAPAPSASPLAPATRRVDPLEDLFGGGEPTYTSPLGSVAAAPSAPSGTTPAGPPPAPTAKSTLDELFS